MRALAGVAIVIVIVFIGLIAISTAAQQSKDAAVINGTNASADAWNATTDVTEGIGESAGTLLVYGGIGAALIVALGFAVKAAGSGR